jgi:hypothetical protein
MSGYKNDGSPFIKMRKSDFEVVELVIMKMPELVMMKILKKCS